MPPANHTHGQGLEGGVAQVMEGLDQPDGASSITTEETGSGDAETESEDQSMLVDENQAADLSMQLLADLDHPENEKIKIWICKTFFNQPSRQLLAFYISKQEWYQNDEVEPPIEHDDPLVLNGFLSAGATTRFEYFHESVEGHLCYADDENGPCDHRCPRRDRAAAHARAHFKYRPFACNGDCKKKGW